MKTSLFISQILEVGAELRRWCHLVAVKGIKHLHVTDQWEHQQSEHLGSQ